MGDDPLAAYRRERSQKNNMDAGLGSQADHSDLVQEPSFASSFAKATADKEATAGKPLTEHQALRLAIDAMNEIPNRSLKGEYSNTYTLIPVLEQAYENGKAAEKLRDAALDMYDALKVAQDTILYIAPVNTSKYVGLLGDTIATIQSAIAKATPTPAPQQKVTRERDIEPER